LPWGAQARKARRAWPLMTSSNCCRLCVNPEASPGAAANRRGAGVARGPIGILSSSYRRLGKANTEQHPEGTPVRKGGTVCEDQREEERETWKRDNTWA
jgi:hypothetical protein